MLIRLIFLPLLFIFAACAPQIAPAPTALPSPTPTSVTEDLAQALIPSQKGDLAQLDRLTRYSITMRYDATTATLTGSQQVRYYNRQATPLNEVYFRLFANYPDSGGKITVSRVAVNGVPAVSTNEAQNTAMRVPLARPLTTGAFADFELDYTINVPRSTKQHYADFTANDAIITLPSVYPLIPAYDAKGWHIEVAPPHGDLVYSEVATYAVTVTAPSTLNLIASGSTAATETNANGTTTWSIVGAPMRDFDLNFTRGFEKASAVVGETTINSYYEPSDADAGKRALQVSVDSFKTFEKRVGKYPYRELDVVETPTSAGGIEYPGLVVISRDLYRDAKQRNELEFTVAHEIAHQWLYGLVGDDQVNEPWVDEAFVQYLTFIFYEDVRGDRAAQSVLRTAMQDPYREAKQNGQDKPANLPVAAYADEDIYYAIVYAKAPLFFDAIRQKMGDAAFYQFLKTYFERYRYKIATSDDLLKTAESVYGKSLQTEYQQWILSGTK